MVMRGPTVSRNYGESVANLPFPQKTLFAPQSRLSVIYFLLHFRVSERAATKWGKLRNP